MALIEWKDEFKLGIPAVDEEHRELIDLINETYETLGDENSKLTVLDFLGDLYASISSHFALEEKIMKEKGYDQLRQHKYDHEKLLDEICEFMDKYEKQESFDDESFGDFLETWFVDHFRTKDARLHKHLG